MSGTSQDPIALQNEREALKQECIRLRRKMTEIAEYGETIELDCIRLTYEAHMNKLRESLGLKPSTTLDSIIRTDKKDDLVRSCALMNDELKRLRAENARLREENTRHVMACNERDKMITESSAQQARVLEAIERGLGGHTFCVDGIPSGIINQIEQHNKTLLAFSSSKRDHTIQDLRSKCNVAKDHDQDELDSLRRCNLRQIELLNERDHTIQELRNKCDTFADERDKIRNELEQRIKAAEHANQRADLITTRMHQYAKIAGDLTTQVKEFEHIKQEIATLRGQIDACTRERGGLVADLVYWRGQYKDAFAQVEDACQRACELEHTVTNMTAQRNTLQAQMQRQREEIDACVRAFEAHLRTVQ